MMVGSYVVVLLLLMLISPSRSQSISVTPTVFTTAEGGVNQNMIATLGGGPPAATVTVNIFVGDTTEGQSNVGSVVFTVLDWANPKPFVISSVDDFVVDGPITYQVTFTTVSTALNFNGLAVTPITVTNNDNDVAGVSINQLAAQTTEAGATAIIEYQLRSQPTNAVTISLTSSDTTEGVITNPGPPNQLIFSTTNWNVIQRVTVTGQDDVIVDGNIAYTITATATSGDPVYQGIAINAVGLTNIDNDNNIGVITNPAAINNLVTSETGQQATFTVTLQSVPTANVIIPLTSLDTTEGTVAPTQLTFTAANWNIAQLVVITGQNDNIIDGNQAYTVELGVIGGASNYNGFNPTDAVLTNNDDDAAGATVTPTTVTVSEAGTTATVQVVLTSQPQVGNTVRFPVSVSDTTEASSSVAQVTFTSADWNIPKNIIITGVDDTILDGTQPFNVVIGTGTVTGTSNPTFSPFIGFNPTDVAGTNTDNEVAGVTVTPTTITVSEAGTTATVQVVLTTQPQVGNTVRFPVSVSDTTEASSSVAQVTFTSADWNIPKNIIITGVDDTILDGTQPFNVVIGAGTVTGTANPALSGFNGFNPTDVAGTNTDNEVAGATVTPATITVSEAGTTATVQVVLTSQPQVGNTVRFPVSVSDTTEASSSVAQVTFTSADWNIPKNIIITGVDDTILDGTQPFNVVIGAGTVTGTANPALSGFNGFNPTDVAGTNTDNEVAGATVTPATIIVSEAGTTATVQVVLTSQPQVGNTVRFPVSVSDTTEASSSVAQVTFTSADWNIPKNIIITGVDDTFLDGTQPFNVVIGAGTVTGTANPALSGFNGFNPTDVAGTNTDNEVAGATVTPATITVSEAGTTATVQIVLTTQPQVGNTVRFPVSVSDTTEASSSVAQVTFTSADWNIPKNIIITGVDDTILDGTQPFNVVIGAGTVTGTANPALSGFNGFNPTDVAGTNTDNEVAGATVTPATITVSEAGTTATVQVVLTSQPQVGNTVRFPVSVSDTTEASSSVPSVAFTSADWNIPKNIIITGVDDTFLDGTQPFNVVIGAGTVTGTANPALSGFNGFNPTDVAGTNTDNEVAGATVTPATITVSEAGTTATVQVVLTAQPQVGNTVQFPISISDATEASSSVPSVAFTSADWNIARNIIITGLDDSLVDGTQPFNVLFGAATVTGTANPTLSGFVNFNPTDVAGTTTDNDVANIRMTLLPIGTMQPVSVTEAVGAGRSSTYTLVLESQPSNSVSIAVVSSQISDATVSTSNVVFTTVNWNIAQTVTITAVDDLLDDGDVALLVTHTVTSTDVLYSGFTVGSITVNAIDNDAGGLLLSSTTLATMETTQIGGSTATFTATLQSQPSNDVSFPLTLSDATEGSISQTVLAFSTLNWNIPQIVTVTSLDDLIVDGNVQYTIQIAASTLPDPFYSSVPTQTITVTNSDNDVAGVTVTPQQPQLRVLEQGTTQQTVVVVLTSQPISNVVVVSSVSDNSEVVLVTGQLTFSSTSWNVPQTFTYRAVDDAVTDGDINWTTSFLVTSPDPVYTGIVPSVNQVTGTTVDNDIVGVNYVILNGLNPATLETFEDQTGADIIIGITLVSTPVGAVQVQGLSSDTTEGSLLPAAVSFSTTNWNVQQTVTISGVDDTVVDGDIAYSVAFRSSSTTDPGFNTQTGTSITYNINNRDNDVDTRGVWVDRMQLTTTENGAGDFFTIRLGSQPTTQVTIPLLVSDSTEGTITPTSISFLSNDWFIPKTVSVNPVSDNIVDGDVIYQINISPAISADPLYSSFVNPLGNNTVTVTNRDATLAGINITPPRLGGLFRTSESGVDINNGNNFFDAVLSSQPISNVILSVRSSNPAEASVDQSTLTFTPANWNINQRVLISGVDDTSVDGDQSYTIIVSPSAGTDPAYLSLPATIMTGVNIDNDGVVNLVVAPAFPATIRLTEGNPGSAQTFRFSLQTAPQFPVTIPVSSSDISESSVSVSSIVLNSVNFRTGVQFSISPVSDGVTDGDITHSLVVGPSTSQDPSYNARFSQNVQVITVDSSTNTVLPITVVNNGNTNPNGQLVVTEGSSSQLVVRLPSQPTESVTVPVTVPTGNGLISASPTSVTFTPANWNIPQTVQITRSDDNINSGTVPFSVNVGPSTTLSGQPYTQQQTFPGTSNDNDGASTSSPIVINNIPSATIGQSGFQVSTSEVSGSSVNSVLSLRLGFAPTSAVTVVISSSDPSEGIPSPNSLVFSSGNWNSVQTVSVIGQDDQLIDGTVSYSIVMRMSSADSRFSNVETIIPAVNNDNDASNIIVSPQSGLVTTESGDNTNSRFTVVLSSQPTGQVSLSVGSSDITEGSAIPSQLLFSTSSWNVPQTVTVTGVSDNVVDGDVIFSVTVGSAQSSDPAYNGSPSVQVSVTNRDVDNGGGTVVITTAPSGTPLPTFAPNRLPSSSDDSLASWAIALIVIAVLLFCCLLAFLLWRWHRSKKAKDKQRELDNLGSPHPVPPPASYSNGSANPINTEFGSPPGYTQPDVVCLPCDDSVPVGEPVMSYPDTRQSLYTPSPPPPVMYY